MGNNGTNAKSMLESSSDYFVWLRDLNVNWVGISVALHLEDSMDSTVGPRYSGSGVLTASDTDLVNEIRAFRQHGFNVYLTLAFELDNDAVVAEHPVARWQLGEGDAYLAPAEVLPMLQKEYWPWDPAHPDHERFVREFFHTYTEQAVHYARIAQAEGVGMFSLGTETDGLFRTRSGDGWTNDFGNELRTMVSAVRAVYNGYLTYDMTFYVLTQNDFYGPGSNHLWEDLGLDVIGLSAYFSLTDTSPNRVLNVTELESRWEVIFQQYIVPLHDQNPGKPIIFTEFGYTDSLASPYTPSADQFAKRVLIDSDNNGKDDGEEMQANILEAFFNVMDRHPAVVSGAFLWNNTIASNETWNGSFGKLRGFDVRNKIAEDIVRTHYAQWSDQP